MDTLDVIALQEQPQLEHKQLLKGQAPPRTLCFLLALRLVPAPDGLHLTALYFWPANSVLAEFDCSFSLEEHNLS